MPVAVLIGAASAYAPLLTEHFKSSYRVVVTSGAYVSVRSSLANMDKSTLYVVPGLSKPERYEIFCLARKNSTQFVSVAVDAADGLVPSDKNPLVMPQFDGAQIEAALKQSGLNQTVANKRSKCVSMSRLGDVKKMVERVNQRFVLEYGQIALVLNSCESRIMKMYSHDPSIALNELETCYSKIVEVELEAKHISPLK
ncbi:hypothetical protein PAPHI01_1987 [Pancytospora philotis]|nr:hypothetical protein PAPHI01_1987 [Pancytospora philotis]